MKRKPFEELNTKVSRLGFGCMRFPTTAGDKIDKEKSLELIDYAYENGITYYDTAWGYHEEESQVFMGEALSRYPRDSFYLATKLPLWKIKDGLTVEGMFEEQQVRCQTDYFDYYLVHAMNADLYTVMEETKAYEYLLKKKEEGLIKHLGFSFHGDMETLEKLLNNYTWDFVQLQVNYFDMAYPMSNADKEYKMVTDRGLPVIVMEPIRGGFLANPPEKARAVMEAFAPGVSPAAWALRWCLHHNDMKLVLSGMGMLDQVKENIATFANAKPLTTEELAMLAQVADIILSVDTVPCTACRYCMECPFGVDIPGLFSMYNQYQIFGNEEEAKKKHLKFVEDNADFNFCMNCGECLPLCPQNIQIPEQLARISPVFEKFAE